MKFLNLKSILLSLSMLVAVMMVFTSCGKEEIVNVKEREQVVALDVQSVNLENEYVQSLLSHLKKKEETNAFAFDESQIIMEGVGVQENKDMGKILVSFNLISGKTILGSIDASSGKIVSMLIEKSMEGEHENYHFRNLENDEVIDLQLDEQGTVLNASLVSENVETRDNFNICYVECVYYGQVAGIAYAMQQCSLNNYVACAYIVGGLYYCIGHCTYLYGWS